MTAAQPSIFALNRFLFAFILTGMVSMLSAAQEKEFGMLSGCMGHQ
jgi:hypothetical protein